MYWVKHDSYFWLGFICVINIIPTSDFIIEMVPLLKLAVKNEISVKPEEPELPLQKSCSEHLRYFSADLFARLVFFTFS